MNDPHDDANHVGANAHPLAHPLAHPHVHLRTERLALRRLTPSDVDELVGLDADPEVMRHLTGGRPTPRTEIETRVLPAMLAWYERSAGHGYWAATDNSTGRFLGWFHLRPQPSDGDPTQPELGYRLRRDAWGHGYATEGSRALIDTAFRELGATRVWAQTMAVNTGSRRVMAKAGLRYVRTFFQDWPEPIPGSEHGEVEYELRKENHL